MIALIALLAVSPVPDRIVVDLAAPKPANVFRPDEAFGGGLDGMGRGEVKATYTPHNVAAMRQAGLRKERSGPRPGLLEL